LILRLPRGGKLLDSIVRGRAWIPMLGILLVGIVGMRVEVLKLGSSVGAEMQQASVLESANATMQKQVSALSDNQRIEQLASKQGMVMPGPLDIHFVHTAGAASVGRAIADVTAPSPTTFLSSVESEREHDGQAAVTAATTSAIGVLGGASISSSTATSGTSSTSNTTAQTTSLAGTPSSTATDPTQSTVATQSTAATTSTDATQSTAPPTAASTDPSTSDTSAATDNVPAATSTSSNGAASLGG
jgi:cell division protein FtsL